MEGIREPSQALLDECAHQYDTKVIRYIEPAKCNSRELEISVGKSDRKLRIETNSLTIRETKNSPEEDIIFRIQVAALFEKTCNSIRVCQPHFLFSA